MLRTRRMQINLSALLITFYEPLKLAEDLAVLDILSGGRLRMTLGMGYRPHEFAMFGVDPAQRLGLYLERIDYEPADRGSCDSDGDEGEA